MLLPCSTRAVCMLVGEKTLDEIRWWIPKVEAESVLSMKEKKLWTYG